MATQLASNVKPFSEALDKLEEFRRLPQDWDSYGAPPISDAALARARGLLTALADRPDLARDERARPAAAVPVATGGVQIEWEGPGGDLELEVHQDGSVSYLLVTDGDDGRRFHERSGVSQSDILRALQTALGA